MAVIIKNEKQLQEAYETLNDLKKARKKILVGGQSYTTAENMTINRANLAEIAREIEAYESAIDAYETHGSSKRRVVRAVPLG